MLKVLAALSLDILLVVSPAAFVMAQDQQLPCDAEPTDMLISAGEIISCDISPVTDTDIYRFEATVGHWLMLTVTDRSGGSPLVRAELYDPHGTPLDTLGVQDTGERMIWEVAETGTYTILVRESGDDQGVSYNLALQSLFPPSAEAEDLCIDCELARGIDVIGDSDLYLFDAEVGTTMLITFTDQSGGSPLGLADIYAPDQQLLETLGTQDTGEAWMFSPPQSGTYTVLVRESGDDQGDSYSLGLQRIFPRPATSSCIEYGDVANAAISPVADSDIYVFGGNVGSQIILTLADQSGGSPHPVAEVYDPNQQLVQTLSPQDNSVPWQVTLTETGLYTVLLYEGGNDQGVTYNLGLQCLFGDCPACSQVPVKGVTWGAMKSMYR